MSIRVLLADDDAAIRATVSGLLISSGCRVVGEASDGEDAVCMALGTPADVIVMDHQMPRLTGLQAARRLRRRGLRTPIVLFTADELAGAQAAGVKAVSFVRKSASAAADVVRAVHSLGKEIR